MFGGNKKKPAGTSSYKDHSFVAPNTEITGDIRFVGGLHVEGKVHGNISSDDGMLHVHGEVHGEVRVSHIVINGVVNGNVYCAEHLELAEKAHITGNVYYKTMEMQLGAQINGSLLRSEIQPVQLIEHKPDHKEKKTDIPLEVAKVLEPGAGKVAAAKG